MQQESGTGTTQAGDGRLPLPRQTTPTWEVEMLLSAGVVFALFQAPDPLHRWADHAAARLGDSGDLFVAMLQVYALMAVYALIATFLVHLTARAYWVALVGISSVYPEGIRWDRYSGGPISKRELQRQIPSFAGLVERADNAASLVFAFGLLMVMSALLGAAVALPALGAAILLAETVLDDVPVHLLLGAMLALALLPLVGIGLTDKLLGRASRGERPPPGWFERLATRFQRLAINRLPAPLMLMLATNQGNKRAYSLFFLALLLMMGLLLADLALRNGDARGIGYDFLPRADAPGVYARNYRDRRVDPLAAWSAPTLQSLVVGDDWLQLLVPYDPERHEPVVEHDCGLDAPGLASDLAHSAGDPARAAAETALLDCLARHLRIGLDGAPLEGLDLAFSEDPGTGLPALLAMLPVAGLAPGRHEVTVARLPDMRQRQDPEALEKLRQAGPVRIPFWR